MAALICEAAADGTDRLRYLIGDDARHFVEARREMTEEDYILFVRSHFRQETPADDKPGRAL